MSKFYTNKRWKCVDCGSENITFQVFIIQQGHNEPNTENLVSETYKVRKQYYDGDYDSTTININYKEVQIDWDHDNIGNCLECLTEVGIEEVK